MTKQYPVGSIVKWQWDKKPNTHYNNNNDCILLILEHKYGNIKATVLYSYGGPNTRVNSYIGVGAELWFVSRMISRMIASSEAEWERLGKPTTEPEVVHHLYVQGRPYGELPLLENYTPTTWYKK